jgi:hypothetical protein
MKRRPLVKRQKAQSELDHDRDFLMACDAVPLGDEVADLLVLPFR